MARRVAGLAAGVGFVAALATFGAALDGYGQARHPVALLGASGVPRAAAFNLFGYVLPGLLAAFVALARRGHLPDRARASARLGWTLALLAALAFAAQGLLPLDPEAPDSGTGRLHGVAWGAWGIAFPAAAAALAFDALADRRAGIALLHAAAGTLMFAFAWLAGDALPLAVAQRSALACWFAWLAAAAWPHAVAQAGRPQG